MACGNHGSSCWIWAVAMGAGWWLAASAVLFFTWNKVIVDLFTQKTVKFWQALLVVATVALFCAPRMAGKGKMGCASGGGSCEYRSQEGKHCDHAGGPAGDNESDCECDHDGEKSAAPGAMNDSTTG